MQGPEKIFSKVEAIIPLERETVMGVSIFMRCVSIQFSFFFQWTIASLIKKIKHEEILYYEEIDVV